MGCLELVLLMVLTLLCCCFVYCGLVACCTLGVGIPVNGHYSAPSEVVLVLLVLLVADVLVSSLCASAILLWWLPLFYQVDEYIAKFAEHLLCCFTNLT